MPNKNNSLTASNIRYLLALNELSAGDGEKQVRSSDVANALGISKPSVHDMMNTLKSMQMVEKDQYSRIRMTDLGRETAAEYRRYYDAVRSVLESVLPDRNELDAAVWAILSEVSPEGLAVLCERVGENDGGPF